MDISMNITFEPATIDVSDDRGSVPGARVSVGGDYYELIPPEGDGPDCWGADEIVRSLESRSVDTEIAAAAATMAATEGAAGHGGTIRITPIGAELTRLDTRPSSGE